MNSNENDLHLIDNLLIAMWSNGAYERRFRDIEDFKNYWGHCVSTALERLHKAWNARELKSITATWSIYFAELDGIPWVEQMKRWKPKG